MEYINVSIMVRGEYLVRYWLIRILAKISLSRLPFSYSLWSKIGFFRHGMMDNYLYVWRVLKFHTRFIDISKKWRGLEIGPGDSALSALLASSINCKGLTLVDSGYFIKKDVSFYSKQIQCFNEDNPGLKINNIDKNLKLKDILNEYGSSFHSEGVTSLKNLKSESYDLIYSQAVLEHIRLDEFEGLIKECFRLISKNGVMSHVVDYKDHLGGGLNNMRFSSNLWEREWFAHKSGFYTNRIKLKQMVAICEKIGFSVKIESTKKWSKSPIQKKHLANEFHNISEEDLLVQEAHLIMRI